MGACRKCESSCNRCKCACNGILPIDALAQVRGHPSKRKTKRRIKKASTTTKKPQLRPRRKKMALNTEEKAKKKRNKIKKCDSDMSTDDGEQSLYVPTNKSMDTTSGGTGLTTITGSATTITGKSLQSLRKSQERSRNENQSDGVLDDGNMNHMPVEIDAIETNSLVNTVLSPSTSFTNLNNIPNLLEFPQVGFVDKLKQQNDVFYEDTLNRNNKKVAMLIDYFKLPTHYKNLRAFSDTLLQKQHSRSKRMVTMIINCIEKIANVVCPGPSKVLKCWVARL